MDSDFLRKPAYDECSWRWWYGNNIVFTTQVAVGALLLAVLVVSWWVSMRSRNKGVVPLPPGPRGLPLVGNLPFLEADLHRCFAKLAQIYGPIMKVQLGLKLYVVLSSPSLAREVLKVQDAVFANRDPPVLAAAMTYGGIDIVWSPSGPEWRKMRKVFAHEMMSNKRLEDCYYLRRQEVREMVKQVHAKAKIDGSQINVGEVMFFTMINLIMSMLWGATLPKDEKSSIGEEIRRVLREMRELAVTPNISDIFPLLASLDIQGIERKTKKLLSRLNDILDPIINQRLNQMSREEGVGTNEKKESQDFLQLFLRLKQTDGQAPLLTKLQVKALLQDMIGAGADTTTTTIEWAMAEMIRHPEIMRKAQEELKQVVGTDNIVEESHLPKLSYLNAVLKESHRLHPPLPLLISHCPSMSCTVGGYTIPKGTNVFVNVWAMHRDPNEWENPLTFLPERFLSDSNTFDYKGTNFCYLPFGSGRRMCAGVPMAEKMIVYVLASLLHSFKWQLPDGVNLDLSEEFGVVLKTKWPVLLIPTPTLTSLKLYC